VVAVKSDVDARFGGVPPEARFELVLHHRYTSGTASDLSGNGNAGYRVVPSTADAPVAAGLEEFDGRGTRVVVCPSDTLADFGGVRVRARVRLASLGDRRTIIEGYLAFAVLVEPDGSLVGGVCTDGRWEGVGTSPGAVPLDRWVELAFVYDGHDTAILSLDGRIIASKCVPLGSIGSVRWPYGLNIGAWPDGNLRVFSGQIAEVWLWRLAR
jgi:hypothetical protein